MNFSRYNANESPLMLHFQYKGSEDVFRYVLVERIPINEIDHATRRKKGESMDEQKVLDTYKEV